MGLCLFLHMSVIFSGSVSVTLLPLPANQGNIKFYITFSNILRMQEPPGFLLSSGWHFSLCLAFEEGCFCCEVLLSYCEVLLSPFRRSGCSECEFWWWPKGANADEKAEPHPCVLGRQGAPDLTWKAAVIQSGLGQRDINELRGKPKIGKKGS